MARFYLILGALVWLALRSCHADGRVFVLERQNTSESGEEWAKQACAERSSRLASVTDLWHAILECSFAVCTRGWMDGTTVGTTVCKNENGAGLRTVDVKVEDDIVEEEERQLNAFCVKDKGAPCGAPPTFPHTHLQSQTGLELGDELLFVCESGYSLASGDTSFSLLCDSCGEWYGLVQLCVKDDAEAHLDYEDKFPEGANVYSDSEDGGSQAEERGEEEEEQRESRESHTEGTSEGTDGVTHEREEDGHAAEGHENAGEGTKAGNAELVTDPPVSVLSQKHLFWFPSEAFHDDDHVDTHTSDHKHSGAKETESGVEGAVDQGHHDEDPTEEVEEGQYHDPIEEEHHDGDHSTVEQHGNVHVKEEHQEHDHVEEELHEDDHAEEKHYDKGQVEEEFHEDDHTEEEHHEKGHVEEEHHEGGHVEEEHHEGGHVEEEHHEGGHVEEEHHEGGHVEEEHHEGGHVEEEHHEGGHVEEEHHEKGHVEEEHHEGGHVEEEHYEDGHVEEEHHEDGHVEEEHHGNGHVKEHHDDHTEEELPTDEVLQHTNKSWLDGYPVDEEFTKSTEIGSEEKEVTDSREVEESEKSEEYEKSIEGSEETFKGVIKHPDAVEMHPTFFLNVSDITTALPYLHTSMESLNGDGSDVTTPSGVGPYEMTLDTTATPVVYGSTGTTGPKFFLHTSLPTESNDMTVFAEDITSVPFHVALSPDDVTAKDELESPALTTVLPDDVTSLSTDVPSVLIHDISGVDSDHHNLTKQSMPTDNPCEADACPSSRSSSLAAIITVGVIVAVVGLALGAWLYRRRQQKSSHYQFNGTNSHTQNFEMQQTV